MSPKAAEALLPCYRAERPMDARIAKAAKIAKGDAVLGAKLEAQLVFDQEIIDAIRAIEPPETSCICAGATSDATAAPVKLRTHIFHPAILAALAGALLTIGFFTWTTLDHRGDFPGRGAVEKIAAVAGRMSGAELERTHSTAGELGDIFYMHGFEGFALPPGIARLSAVGARVFKQDGHPVAQIAIDSHDSLIAVFRAADFGVKLDGEPDWKIFDDGGLISAIIEKDGICTLVTFHGDEEEMRVFLNENTQ